MSLYTLFLNNTDYIQERFDFEEGSVAFSLSDVIESVKEGQEYLRSLPIESLIGFWGEVCQFWSTRDSQIQQKLSPYGLNFLLYWLKPSHLRQVVEGSLRVPLTALDDFSDAHSSYQIIAQPKGIIGHWLSGNVPMLGVLSLVQGVLSKNANVLKVSSQNVWMLPLILKSIGQVRYVNESGICVDGSKLVKSISVIYFESHKLELQKSFSEAVQVRMAWGGVESVEAIMNTPRQYGTEDVVFGPKTSFAVIGKECLNNEVQAREVAKRIASDVMVFDQQGCNAPHTLFVEIGGVFNGRDFSAVLSQALKAYAARESLNQPGEADVFEILSQRVEYDMRATALYPSGFDWTVLYAKEDEGLADPCYYRTLFIRPIEDIMQVAQYCSHWTQSVGVALSRERKRLFSKVVASAGVDRIPDIGRMSLYEIPWDGMFVMDRLVRWCKLDYSYDFVSTLAK